MVISDERARQLSLSHFYTFDGTWRTKEPSWRLLLRQQENVCGCPSKGNTLNDPTLLNDLDRGRRARETPADTAAARFAAQASAHSDLQTAAVNAADAFCALNFKDQKLSGFANETLCHTFDGHEDPERWARLGMMTRERLVGADQFGDVSIPRPTKSQQTIFGLKPTTFPRQGKFPPWGSLVEPMPGPPELTGFTRRPQLHSSADLTGGFVYAEPTAAPAAASSGGEVKVVGNKLATGFSINNTPDAAARTGTPAAEGHWERTSIGSSGIRENWYHGAGARVTKYGEYVPRKLAPHETSGPVTTLQVETSGFTRNLLHEKDTVRTTWNGMKPEASVERKLEPTQLALRRMANPIEYADPHAHKSRMPS